jgi:hypothetical protein
MAEQPSRVHRATLEAVLDALDIPFAATVGHAETRQKILADRAMHAVIALRSILDDADGMFAEVAVSHLRAKLAEHPATGYVTTEQAHQRLAEGANWMQAVALPGGDR